MSSARPVIVVLAMLAATASAEAQTIGPFRWQFQPYCNVVTVTLTQAGPTYLVAGSDDQCTGPDAAVTGLALPRGTSTVGLGLTIVLTPGAAPLHVTATIDLATISGSWTDSAGRTGPFVFNPAIAPGAVRPNAPPLFVLGVDAGGQRVTRVGPPTSSTDATNRAYVDQAVLAAPRDSWLIVMHQTGIASLSPDLITNPMITDVVRPAALPVGAYCVSLAPAAGAGPPIASIAKTALGQENTQPSFITVGPPVGCPAGARALVETYDVTGARADRAFHVMFPR